MTTIVEIDTGEGLTIVEVVEANPTQIVAAPDPAIQIIEVVGEGPQGPRGPQGEQGPQGIQGPPGNNGGTMLGGYGVSVSDVQQSDFVQFSALSQVWVNSNLMDGGNF